MPSDCHARRGRACTAAPHCRGLPHASCVGRREGASCGRHGAAAWVWPCHRLGASLLVVRSDYQERPRRCSTWFPARALTVPPLAPRDTVESFPVQHSMTAARPHMISANPNPHQPASTHLTTTLTCYTTAALPHQPFHRPCPPPLRQSAQPTLTRPMPKQTSDQGPEAFLRPIASPAHTPCSIDTTRLKKGPARGRGRHSRGFFLRVADGNYTNHVYSQRYPPPPPPVSTATRDFLIAGNIFFSLRCYRHAGTSRGLPKPGTTMRPAADAGDGLRASS